MRSTKWTSRFKKDVRREMSGRFAKTLQADLNLVTGFLANNEPLPFRFRDHALTGHLKDHRDCHLHPDLVLIYRIPDAQSLELVRLGSHSELEL